MRVPRRQRIAGTSPLARALAEGQMVAGLVPAAEPIAAPAPATAAERAAARAAARREEKKRNASRRRVNWRMHEVLRAPEETRADGRIPRALRASLLTAVGLPNTGKAWREFRRHHRPLVQRALMLHLADLERKREAKAREARRKGRGAAR